MAFQSNLYFVPTSLSTQRFKDAKKTKNVSILFLGSSHAYRGFDPRIFANLGIKTFNLGSSSQTPLQTEVLLKRYLTTLNPKIVIYEVNPEIFSSDGVEASLDIIANDQNDKHSFGLAKTNVKVFNSLIFSLLPNTKQLKIPHGRPVEGNDTYIPGGFVERRLTYFNTKPFPKKINWTFRKDQLKHFESIIMMLEAANIDIILVSAPITKNKFTSYLNYENFDLKMKSYATYLNFNFNTRLNDSLHFYDSHHMNQKGVELFNRQLIDTLSFALQRSKL